MASLSDFKNRREKAWNIKEEEFEIWYVCGRAVCQLERKLGNRKARPTSFLNLSCFQSHSFFPSMQYFPLHFSWDSPPAHKPFAEAFHLLPISSHIRPNYPATWPNSSNPPTSHPHPVSARNCSSLPRFTPAKSFLAAEFQVYPDHSCTTNQNPASPCFGSWLWYIKNVLWEHRFYNHIWVQPMSRRVWCAILPRPVSHDRKLTDILELWVFGFRQLSCFGSRALEELRCGRRFRDRCCWVGILAFLLWTPRFPSVRIVENSEIRTVILSFVYALGESRGGRPALSGIQNCNSARSELLSILN